MASTMAAPELRAASDGRGSSDTRLDLVSRVYSASCHLTFRVLIANHQPIVRYGLCDLIESEPDLHLAGEADDGEDAVRMARQLRPDVVLIDLSMPTVDGISATLMIRAELPDTQVIVTSGLDDDISTIEAIRAGAMAYLLKDSPIDELLRTIRGAGGGQVALPMQTAGPDGASDGRA